MAQILLVLDHREQFGRAGPRAAGRLEMHAEAAAQLRNLGVTVDVRAATRGRPPLTPDMVGMTGCCSVRARPCTLICAQACSGALCQGAA